MTGSLNRAQLLRRSAQGGAVLVFAGSVAGSLGGQAKADVISDADLAYARLLVGAELLAADFYGQAIAAKQFDAGGAQVPEAGALQRAGALQLRRDDPERRRSGACRRSGHRLRLSEGLVRVEGVDRRARRVARDGLPRRVPRRRRRSSQAEAFKQPLARIAASEAQHLSVFTGLPAETRSASRFRRRCRSTRRRTPWTRTPARGR